MRGGFTLVELSIVLVIVGLLTGGILVAQSLIESTKLNSFVRQLAQYDAGVASFQSKYRQIPGDSGVAFTKATTGTPGQTAIRERLLTDENTQNNSVRYAASGSAEYLLFWLELAVLTKLSLDNCPNLTARADPFAGGMGIRKDGDDCNVAKAEYGEIESSIMAAAYDINSPNTSPATYIQASHAPYNSYFMGDCSSTNGSGPQFFVCEPTFTQTQALAVDSKIDDGIPNSGEVTSFDDVGWEEFRINDKNLLTGYDPTSNTLVSVTVKMEAY